MRTMTVKECLAQVTDAPISQVRGKITNLYPYKSGESQHGQWSFQSGTIRDITGEIRFTLKNREELDKGWKGCDVIFTAHERPGGKGLSGIKIGEHEYQGKTSPELVLTGTANIEGDNGGVNEQPADESDEVPMEYPDETSPSAAKGKAIAEKQLAEAHAKRAKVPPPSKPAEPEQEDPADAWENQRQQASQPLPPTKATPAKQSSGDASCADWLPIMRGMAQQARLLEVATRAALKIVVPVYMKHQIDPSVEAVQAMAATILIQWQKEYGGRVDVPIVPVPAAND